jgi:hypothetical protein
MKYLLISLLFISCAGSIKIPKSHSKSYASQSMYCIQQSEHHLKMYDSTKNENHLYKAERWVMLLRKIYNQRGIKGGLQ